MKEILERNKALKLAEEFGRVAAHDGLTINDCKYYPGTDLARHWRIGFTKQYTGQ